MEEKKYKVVYQRILQYLRSKYAEKIVLMALSFLSGMVSARGLVFGRYEPFGIAVLAAVPKAGMWPAFFGAFIGYLFPSPALVPARYAASLIAVIAIRWSLSELKRINSHMLYAPIISFAPLMLTGVLMIVMNGSMEYTAALYVAEAFLAAGSAFFLNRTANILTNRKKGSTWYNNMDTASVMMTVCIFILAFSNITVAGISIGRILTVLLVLYCARIGGISAGSIAGIIAGAVQGLSGVGLSYLSGAYGLGGLMAGVFAPLGKIAVAISFIISHGVSSLQVGDSRMVLVGAIEVSAATIIYMALPKNRYITDMLTIRKDTLSGNALRNNVVMRLRHSSNALKHVHNSVEEVSQKLSTISACDMQGVYDKATDKICAGCGKSTLCWGQSKSDTVHTFASLTLPLKEKGSIEKTDFQDSFLNRCSRTGEMRDLINKNYNRYLLRETAELRSSQIREVVKSHFHATSGVLSEMAEEFSNYEHFDEESAQRIRDILQENGISPIEVCCRTDKYDRMTIEAEIEKKRQKRINRSAITKEISAACGRVFAPPCISTTQNACLIQMYQRPAFEILRGFSQYNANNSAFCGDCAAAFYDGRGRLIAIISDGMGTGGHAAVDGAMATAMSESLTKAGIGYDSMLQTINTALIAKSGEESLATLDMVSVDLFTGKTEFRKAGAAGTVVRRKNETEFIELSSMPLGILPETMFAQTTRELESGDMIVMISDGVVPTGSKWLIDMVKNCKDDIDPNVLSEQIIERAQKERANEHEDDVSVLVLVLE